MTKFLILFTAVGLIWASGCSDLGETPLAPENQASVQESGEFTIGFSPKTPRAGKLVRGGLHIEQTSGLFTPRKGDELDVRFKNDAHHDEVQLQTVRFEAEKKSALSQPLTGR